MRVIGAGALFQTDDLKGENCLYRAKRFFRRIDIFRNYSRALLLVCLFAMFSGKSFSVMFIVFSVGAVVFGIGSILKVPKPSEIAEFVSDQHHAFEQEIRRKHSNVNEREFHTLCAFSPKRSNLARGIGNQMYFPEFATLVFQKTERGLILYRKTVYLYENIKPTVDERAFCDEGSLLLECGEAESAEDYRLVIFKSEGETVMGCYIRNDHQWNTFLSFDPETVRVESIKAE